MGERRWRAQLRVLPSGASHHTLGHPHTIHSAILSCSSGIVRTAAAAAPGRAPQTPGPGPRSYAEHSGRKRASLQAVADEAGVCVAALDLHGHGRSEPREAELRGVVRSYQHLVSQQGPRPGPKPAPIASQC
jgi:hypothetical protein